MHDKSASRCSAAKAAISAADAQYTPAAWCFAGADETSDAWVPQAVTSNRRMLVRIYTNEYNDAPSGCPTQ
ncbi:hypothetical protein ACPPVO_37400 [Dactylosporangium sp. McL0621]|uniref:hypothetical protein n=1 Tax=Dactylosporangium sp. McL0621 TaxID=3415678 RepID=UPI003CEB88EA